MNLMSASRQWATRPADERFWSLPDLLAATTDLRDTATVLESPAKLMQAQPGDDGEIEVWVNGAPTYPTNFAFDQLAGTMGAPGKYLRTLTPTLASECINHGLRQLNGSDRQILTRSTPGIMPRMCALTSQRYDRIWDSDVAARLIPLQEQGWRVPPARPAPGGDFRARVATKEDCLRDRGFGLSISPGDMIAPAGIYASDRDMFVFMVNEDRTVNVPGSDTPLCRGFWVENSEVGAAAFKVTMFLYAHVCGNHIIWDASNVKKLRIVHMGREGSAGQKAFEGMHARLTEYSDRSATEDEAIIARAVDYKIGDDKDDVLDSLFGRGVAPRQTLGQAYDLAQEHPEDGHKGPDTAWGMVQGLTRAANELEFAGHRADANRGVARVLNMVPA